MNKLITLSLVIFLSGCIALPIPHDRRVTPMYSGKVIDFDSRIPIKGVVVKVETLIPDRETGIPYTATTMTNEEGYYELGAVERSVWYILWFGPAEGVCGGKVTFTHPEYNTYQYDTQIFTSAAMDGVCTLKEHERDVLLSRITSNNSLNQDAQ